MKNEVFGVPPQQCIFANRIFKIIDPNLLEI